MEKDDSSELNAGSARERREGCWNRCSIGRIAIEIDGLTREYRYYLKAMNCPHHHRIFAAEQRSYRDLPLRLAEYGTCYRYEQSGEFFGLMRVRSLK